MNHRRRTALKGLLATTAVAMTPGTLWAQALSDRQRDDFARQFGLGGGNATATNDILDIIGRNVSERVQAPLRSTEFRAFLQNLRTLVPAPSTSADAQDISHFAIWHELTSILNAHDHTTLDGDQSNSAFAEQLGPARSSWALALAHLAMFEAANILTKRYESFRPQGAAASLQEQMRRLIPVSEAQLTTGYVSIRQAIGTAAFQTLSVLYPKKRQIIDYTRLFAYSLIPEDDNKNRLGQIVGEAAARVVLESRAYDEKTKLFGDGSAHREPLASEVQGARPQDWQRDPITKLETALGGRWRLVWPFVIGPAEIALPAPPPESSAEFQRAFEDVRRLGGDPNVADVDPRFRTETDRVDLASIADAGERIRRRAAGEDETFNGIFWGYDGTALLCAPPRLYNAVALRYATAKNPQAISKVEDLARYMALINIAMADAGIAAWTAKYQFLYPRPITYIRQKTPDEGFKTTLNRYWTPLGAPVTNGRASQRNLSPPFPAYPSGHAVFGAALFQVIREVFNVAGKDSDDDLDFAEKDKGHRQEPSKDPGTDFVFVSDEYNGLNVDPATKQPRERIERAFKSLAEAERENAQSRIWLGIHWQFDADQGIRQGRKVARKVAASALTKI